MRGLAERQAIACGSVEGLGWRFLHSSHSETEAGSLKLLLEIGAYALINVKEKVHIHLSRVRRFHVRALSRGGRQAAATQLLDCRHLFKIASYS